MRRFRLKFTAEAEKQLQALADDKGLAKRLKAVRKSLAYLEINPRHPGLRTHKFHSISGLRGEEIFEAYGESKTPAAYRIFWHYGPAKNEITIITIVPHP